jgi:type IV pilus assembly protein PilC
MATAIKPSVGEKKVTAYRYEATTPQGKRIKGTIRAPGEIDAERMLISQGYAPVSIDVVPSMWSLEEALPSLFHVKPKDVIMFSRQLATLLRSGISLLPAMEILADQLTGTRTFKKILEAIEIGRAHV